MSNAHVSIKLLWSTGDYHLVRTDIGTLDFLLKIGSFYFTEAAGKLTVVDSKIKLTDAGEIYAVVKVKEAE